MLPSITSNYLGSYCHSVMLASLVMLQMTIAATPVQDAAMLQKRALERIERCVAQIRKTGNLQSVRDELRQAEDDLSRSHQEFVRRQNWAAAALSLNKMADVQRLQLRWPQAAVLYRQAHELARRANHAGYQVKALLGQARVAHLGHKDYDAALRLLDEALRLAEQGADKKDVFDLYDLKGGVLGSRGQLAAAFEMASRAFALATEINEPAVLFYAYFGRASIYQDIGLRCDYQRALRQCISAFNSAYGDLDKAAGIAREQGFDFLLQILSKQLADNRSWREILSSAERHSATMLSAEFLNPTRPGDALVSENFASSLPLPPAQEKFFEDFFKLPTEDVFRYHNEAMLLEWRGQFEPALDRYRRAVELLEADRRRLDDETARGAFVEDKMAVFYYPILLLLQLRRHTEAFELMERSRSRVLADLLQTQGLKLASTSDREFYAESVRLNARIAQLQKDLLALRTAAAPNPTKLATAQTELQRLEGDYQKLVAGAGRGGSKLQELLVSRPASLAALQQTMKQEGFETLSYLATDSQIVLWHISGDAVHVRSVFLPHEQLIAKVAALRRSLKDPRAKFDEKTARELFLFLIQPALEWIKSDRLVIIPHDDLHYIPFQTLIDPAGRALGERFSLSYAPSATVLLRLKKSENIRAGRLLAVADPDLVEAKREVEAIGKLYPSRSRIVSNALVKEDELKRMVAGYDLIHLSVHGKFVAQEPLLSHLILKPGANDDGQLTAAEMFGLPLENARLVVLSACDTGQAQATRAGEVIGMVRALLYAGANTLALSSWEVDAASTALWMETFYGEAQTKTPVEAARAAMIAVKRDPRYAHPYFWSPFLLIGR